MRKTCLWALIDSLTRKGKTFESNKSEHTKIWLHLPHADTHDLCHGDSFINYFTRPSKCKPEFPCCTTTILLRPWMYHTEAPTTPKSRSQIFFICKRIRNYCRSIRTINDLKARQYWTSSQTSALLAFILRVLACLGTPRLCHSWNWAPCATVLVRAQPITGSI